MRIRIQIRIRNPARKVANKLPTSLKLLRDLYIIPVTEVEKCNDCFVACRYSTKTGLLLVKLSYTKQSKIMQCTCTAIRHKHVWTDCCIARQCMHCRMARACMDCWTARACMDCICIAQVCMYCRIVRVCRDCCIARVCMYCTAWWHEHVWTAV